jgi:tRNA 2-thiouridine synthesizing protein A
MQDRVVSPDDATSQEPPLREVMLDLKGLKCPLPALKTRKALGPLAPGDVIEAQCTDPLSAIDIPNLVRETGDTLLAQERRDQLFIFRIRREARRHDDA